MPRNRVIRVVAAATLIWIGGAGAPASTPADAPAAAPQAPLVSAAIR